VLSPPYHQSGGLEPLLPPYISPLLTNKLMYIATMQSFVMGIGSNYTCTNGNEINVEMLCDEINDCGDNSDENLVLCPGRLYMYVATLVIVNI